MPAGSEEYDQLRPLSYPGTEVFLLCFSLVAPETAEHIYTKWYPEIVNAHKENWKAKPEEIPPLPPVVLVGTKLDLRSKPEIIKKLEEEGKKPITTSMGETLAQKIGAKRYIECSALTQENLSKVFEEAARVVLNPNKPAEVGDQKAGNTGAKDKDCNVM